MFYVSVSFPLLRELCSNEFFGFQISNNSSSDFARGYFPALIFLNFYLKMKMIFLYLTNAAQKIPLRTNLFQTNPFFRDGK